MPNYLRQTADFKLSVNESTGTNRFDLIFADGASIQADSLANIDFENLSGGLIDFNGEISSSGGNLAFKQSWYNTRDFDPSVGVFFGNNSKIDLSGGFISQPSFFKP